jgi:hypothetical protein
MEDIYGKLKVMSIQIIIFIVFGIIALWMLLNPLTKTKDNTPPPPIVTPPTSNDETDQNPIGPGEIIIPGEMPEKPLPVNCQLAQFQPSPQDFFYVDCCGNPQKGEGFQPWEKRSPVAIDSNQPFFGMTLLDVEAEKDC